MEPDPASNVIAVGSFRSTLDLGNGVVADDSVSSEPLFVAKLSPDGTASWLKKIDYTGFGYQAIRHVATDATGAIFLSGYFSDQLTIDAVTIEVATMVRRPPSVAGSSPSPIYLGKGSTLDAVFGLGKHTVTARAFDATHKWNDATAIIEVSKN